MEQRFAPLPPEHALGAAYMLCYLRDLFAPPGGRDEYTRETILKILETISRDPEIFPDSIGAAYWQVTINNAE